MVKVSNFIFIRGISSTMRIRLKVIISNRTVDRICYILFYEICILVYNLNVHIYKSDTMSISLDLLAFAFCLLVGGIKTMRESIIEFFLETCLSRNFQLYVRVNKFDCLRAHWKPYIYSQVDEIPFWNGHDTKNRNTPCKNRIESINRSMTCRHQSL